MILQILLAAIMARAAAPEGAAAAAPAQTAQVPPAPETTVFRPNWEFAVFNNGKVIPNSVCYNATGVPGMLIVAPPLGRPVFARMEDRKVLAVDPAQVRAVDEKLAVARSAYGDPIADWVTRDGVAQFTVEGTTYKVQQRPIALGKSSLPILVGSYPGYRRPMQAYTPDVASINFLSTFAQPVSIDVFFGTWCHTCEENLPKLMRVLADAGNRNLRVTFYGMPREFKSDPSATRYGVTKLPAAIISLYGRELGRIEGRPLRSYEEDLWSILLKAGNK